MRTTLPHFSISSAMNFAASDGEPGNTDPQSSVTRAIGLKYVIKSAVRRTRPFDAWVELPKVALDFPFRRTTIVARKRSATETIRRGKPARLRQQTLRGREGHGCLVHALAAGYALRAISPV